VNSQRCQSRHNLEQSFNTVARCVVLAAYVLERMADQNWETYTRSQIFAPLGMSSAHSVHWDWSGPPTQLGPIGMRRSSAKPRCGGNVLTTLGS
jgi:CubicO group peptidase (beta-lactamase class C family)